MTERSSLLNRRRDNNQQHYNALNDVSPISSFPSTPSIGDIQANNNSAPATFITASNAAYNQHGSNDHHKFKLFNKRHGSYDEDRQGLIKENTGLRVWYESYSTIGVYRKEKVVRITP